LRQSFGAVTGVCLVACLVVWQSSSQTSASVHDGQTVSKAQSSVLSSSASDSWSRSILGKEAEEKQVRGEMRNMAEKFIRTQEQSILPLSSVRGHKGSAIRVHPSDDVHRSSQSFWRSKALAEARKESAEIDSDIADENKKLSGSLAGPIDDAATQDFVHNQFTHENGHADRAMRRSNQEKDKETRLSSQRQYNDHATPLPDMQDDEGWNWLRDIKGSKEEVSEASEILQKKLLDRMTKSNVLRDAVARDLKKHGIATPPLAQSTRDQGAVWDAFRAVGHVFQTFELDRAMDQAYNHAKRVFNMSHVLGSGCDSRCIHTCHCSPLPYAPIAITWPRGIESYSRAGVEQRSGSVDEQDDSVWSKAVAFTVTLRCGGEGGEGRGAWCVGTDLLNALLAVASGM
jgi:hypothetical protein